MQLDYASNERQPSDGRVDLWLVALLLFAVVGRLAWVLPLPTDEVNLQRLPDQLEYLELGRSLLQREGMKFVDLRFGDTVYAYRTPGYPALVAACGGKVRIIRLVQAIVDSSCVLAVYLLARRWLGPSGARLSAIFIAFNPFLVYFTGLILSETLFTAMLIWGMTLLVRSRHVIGWWAGAALLALSTLVRPSGVLLPVVLGVGAAFVNRGTQRPYQWRFSPPVATLMLALTLLALLPWAWRNNRAVGAWIWTTTNSGITLYDGLNPDATGASDQSFVRTLPQLKSMDELGRSQYLKELAWQFVREHPDRVAQLAAIKIARTWSPIPLSSDYGGDRKLVIVSLVYMVPFILLIVLGLWRGAAPVSAKAFLLLPALYLTIAHAISIGSLRYRIPADVPMAVIAGIGFSVIWSSNPRKAEG